SMFPFDDGKIGYEHFRNYLHTDGFRWSNPVMLYRRAYEWQMQVVKQPPDEMVKTLALAGFHAILIDHRLRLADDEKRMAYLKANVDSNPLFDGKSRYVFDMREYRNQLLKALSEDELKNERERVLPSLELRFGGEFRVAETPAKSDPSWVRWRWCTHRIATVYLWNHSQEEIACELKWTAFSAVPEKPASMKISSKLFPLTTLDLPVTGTPFSVPLKLGPGRHEVKIAYEGTPMSIGEVGRSLWFRLDRFSLERSAPE
ncbi:MAG: hypothetical protein ABL921_30760, partial [Pirellula sp.]